ncbi:hypothetical protein SUGI_0420220 [Cryptomeria japonica]|nr:hypothetical protein SUGI_0420220 [Cryptomeria japonica]
MACGGMCFTVYCDYYLERSLLYFKTSISRSDRTGVFYKAEDMLAEGIGHQHGVIMISSKSIKARWTI